jgi:hypothetical protein
MNVSMQKTSASIDEIEVVYTNLRLVCWEVYCDNEGPPEHAMQALLSGAMPRFSLTIIPGK